MTKPTPDNEFAAILNRGAKLLDDGSLDEALTAFRTASRRSPKAFLPHRLAGRCLEAMNRPGRAISEYRQALDVNPDHPEAPEVRFALSRLLVSSGDPPAAVPHIEQAVRQNPSNPEWAAWRTLTRDLVTSNKAPGSLESRPSKSTRDAGMNAQPLFLPTSRTRGEANEYSMTLGPSDREPTDDLPVPPPELMEYGESPDKHVSSGRSDVRKMLAAVDACGFDWRQCETILEFGCGNGRMLRALSDKAATRTAWGADIQSDKVMWAMENLNPPLNFAVTTTVPHLPFPDRHFDLIFAGSVFTHIGELHVAWLLELARLLAPSGFLYITVHDEHAVELGVDRGLPHIAEQMKKSSFATSLRSGEVDFVSLMPYGRGMLSQVKMSSAYVKRLTAPFLRLVDTFPGAYGNLQTGYVLVTATSG